MTPDEILQWWALARDVGPEAAKAWRTVCETADPLEGLEALARLRELCEDAEVDLLARLDDDQTRQYLDGPEAGS